MMNNFQGNSEWSTTKLRFFLMGRLLLIFGNRYENYALIITAYHRLRLLVYLMYDA